MEDYTQKYLKYKNKYIALKNRKLLRGGAIRIESFSTPFNIPAISYPLHLEKIDNYKTTLRTAGLNEDYINIFERVLDNTTHVTFNELIVSIKHCIHTFETKIGDKPFDLYIPIISETIPVENKSNYWISKIFYLLLNKKPENIYTTLDELKQAKYDILMCDDAIYSGRQMYGIFYNYTIEQHGDHLFHILCPFMSEESIRLLNPLSHFKKELYYHITFCSLESLLPKDYFFAKEVMSIGHAYPIYFDHRVADNASSLPYFYVLGRVIVNRKPIYLNSLLHNCEHLQINPESNNFELLEKCPTIPYRPDATKNIIEITPVDFIRRYK